MAISDIPGIRKEKWGRVARLTMSLALPLALLSVAPTLAQEQTAAPVGKDPKNVRKNQEALEADHGVPATFCRGGYVQQGTWLCMTATRGPNTFANAMLDCMDSGGRVADYHDWRYRQQRGDGLPAPVNWWLGPITADDRALFVNLPDVANFDGETSRFESRLYACAHDLLL
jgi:hypothetical protein